MPNTYTNKFVEFLNDFNTIAISGEQDFKELKSLLAKVGISLFANLGGTYEGLRSLAETNRCLIGGSAIIVEYKSSRGLTIGYRSYEDSSKWYGLKPYTMKEVIGSISKEVR